MEDQENYLSPDYQHGFQSGLEKLDKSHFEGYLSNQSNFEWFQGRLTEKKQTLSQVEEAIVETRQKQKTAFDLLQSSILGISIKSRTVQTLKDKLETLFRLICMLGDRSTIIFCNHRESVERTSTYLKDKDILNVFYHGALEQQERDAALNKFRNGTVNVLVTTDLAARGLDIANIRYIIHYHLPDKEDSFTHRNGRTARMDASGTAILILSPEEKLPSYIDTATEEIELPEESILPEKPKWSTLFIAAGKKDKVNKIDIVGFLSNKGQLKKEDIGLIEVKDFFSFVAIKKIKVGEVLRLIKDEKIKNKKVKIAVAK